ncbi:MAG: glutamate 5-kinase [Pseudomonadales bacterium]|nr:glutamate 5-kinase [Pseudomonadales bacterium]
MTSFESGDTWVIKIGSSLLTNGGQGLAIDAMALWVEQIVKLRHAGVKTVLVSSGAVAEGMNRLNMKKRPHSLALLQAAAAVGQMGLVQAYESLFQKFDIHTAQVLLTHADLRSRERYINARGTLKNLLDLGVIPVVNENDTVVTDEIQFGDNDTLAALVSNLIGANTLLLLTDQKGLYDSDPRKSNEAALVRQRRANDPDLVGMAGEGGEWGRGGMVTKIKAGRIAARGGANTVIAHGLQEDVISLLHKGEVMGTLLMADKAVLASRKQWLAGLAAQGRIYLDAGAVTVLREKGRSLLPIGVKRVDGRFTRGEIVACLDESGMEVARGLINYDHEESAAICGRSSVDIQSILGYAGEEELIHRDNLVIV